MGCRFKSCGGHQPSEAGPFVWPGGGREVGHLHKGIGNFRKCVAPGGQGEIWPRIPVCCNGSMAVSKTARWGFKSSGWCPFRGGRRGRLACLIRRPSGFESRSRDPLRSACRLRPSCAAQRPRRPGNRRGQTSAGMHWRAKRSVKACPLGVQVRVLPCRPSCSTRREQRLPEWSNW